ncbi:general substrate transporter [Hyaloscypha finlandica]|nr:general substrate transporter [Hyaloscypha finlandica]
MKPAFKSSDLTVAAPKEIYNWRVYILAIVSSMGAFMFGYDLAFIGTAITLKPFIRDFGLKGASAERSDAFAANIVSLLQAGCFFGSLIAAPLGDKLGRRITLMITGVVFCLGSLMQTVSFGSTTAMFVGRAIGGLGVGAASMLVPLYVAEISPPSIRGRLVGIYEMGVQIGTCIGFWINYGVTKHVAATSTQWRVPFAVQLIPGGLLVLGMIFLPESPRWIARFRGRDEAVAALAKLRNLPVDHEYVAEEIYRVIDQIDQERLATHGKGLIAEFREMAMPGNRNRITIGVVIFIFMQMAGSNAINYYSPRIFKSIGLTGSNTGLISTGVYGIVRLIAITITMYWIVDRFGRTKLLIVGSALAAVAMYSIGGIVKHNPISATAKPAGVTASGYGAAVMVYVFAVAFCLSWAGVPWIYCSEIFPLRIRSLCVAICTATHWLLNFVIARSVPYMLTNIGYGTYFVFAACMTLAVPFVYFFVPETKGLSLEDMDALFGVPGADRHLFPRIDDAEKGDSAVEHKE